MNNQTVVGVGLGALLLFILIGAGVYVSSNMLAEGPGDEQAQDGSVSPEIVEEFTSRMWEETVERVGQPIEGFEPSMFMQAFPGLIASDFANVEASIGLYRYQNGEVVYDLNGEVETHSAARAITTEGMEQLLLNILARVTLMSGEDMLDQVFAAISAEAGPTGPGAGGSTEPTLFGTRVTFAGTIVCLPHKGDGPHTMECAFGLKADNGSHYGIKNLYSGANLAELTVGERVEVTGVLEEPRVNETYDIAGVIDVEYRWPISPSV